MKILVCISKAPDTTTKIEFTDGDTKFNENNVQYIVNPYDEWYALVRGLELKEANGGTVTIITVGGAEEEPVMRKALAIGADDAVRIDAEAKDGAYVAQQIASYAKAQNFDLILTGKETINYNGSQVAGMVAEILDLPFLSLASKLDIDGTTASVELDVKGGKQMAQVNLPFVISCAKGMAEQRIPNMRGIMAARSKPLQVIPAADAYVGSEVVSYELPPAKAAVKLLSPDSMDELVQLLHTEAKVI